MLPKLIRYALDAIYYNNYNRHDKIAGNLTDFVLQVRLT